MILLLINKAQASEKANFIIIFTDDQGYGDLSCYGSTTINTPHLDRMAKEGRKFTSFKVPSAICTPSRAALMTGSYPKRVSLYQHVLLPHSKTGLNPKEYTIANHLKSQGYKTACIGKWHLGHHPETLPRQHGFDYYYGIPFSNDMNQVGYGARPPASEFDALWKDPESTLTRWKTPLVENETVIELPVDQRTITRRYTDKAIDFIKENKDEPFFVYLPHSMPHVPLYVPDDIYDADLERAYPTVIEHIDAEVGRLMDTIRELDLDQNTYVIYTSDNGPASYHNEHGGSAGPLTGAKGSTYEGGHRVPCIMWAPGHITPDTQCNQLLSTMDLLPTIAGLIGTELPKNNKIDGLDASTLILDHTTTTPRKELLYYSRMGHLEGIRKGKWKLLLKIPGELAKRKVINEKYQPEVLLFDLSQDIAETTNLASQNPEIVKELSLLMKELDTEIEQNMRPAWIQHQ